MEIANYCKTDENLRETCNNSIDTHSKMSSFYAETAVKVERDVGRTTQIRLDFKVKVPRDLNFLSVLS